MTKRRFKKKIIYSLIASLLVGISLFSNLGVGAAQARADVPQTPEKYESQSVLDDLSDMTIDGKEFSLSDYPKNAKDSPRILTFVEYCYAYNADMRGYYGLYIYVYNPQQIAFECNSGKNKLEMLAGSMQNYKKYDLQLLSMTMQAGYECRFCKFKVVFTEAQRTAILQDLNAESRVYNLSGIELLDPDGKNYPNATDYPVGGTDENGNPLGITYTYTGYAKGYGEKGTSESTLNCKVDGLETVSLEAHHTTYRPKGTAYSSGYKSKTVRNSLSSVYFAVPKNLRNNYDDLHAVHATWLEAETAPMLVTGNKDVYDNLLQFVGDRLAYTITKPKEGHVHASVDETYMKKAGLNFALHASEWGEISDLTPSDTEIVGTKIRYGTDSPGLSVDMCPCVIDDKKGKFCRYCNGVDNYSGWFGEQVREVDQLNWLFYAPGRVDVADRYCVASQELYNWVYKSFGKITNGIGTDYCKFKEHEAGAGDPWISEFYRIVHKKTELKHGNGVYLPLLDTLASSYRDEKIESDKYMSITSQEWAEKNWGWFWSEIVPDGEVKPISARAVYEVTDEDFASNDKTTICERLLISESDYEDFKKYYEENKENNRIYLFRFDTSEYISTELTEYAIADGPNGAYTTELDTNAYFCKEKIYLDFDIIDITVTKNGEEFVIGCVMSPIDIIPSTTPPPITTSDMPDWWITALITEVVLIVSFIGVVLVKRFIRGKFGK